MYRIKKDKRVTQSAERIREGLLKCLASKKLDEISVSDIARRSGVSRGTFYRIFDTPVDILTYTCDALTDKASKEFLKRAEQNKERSEFGQYWLQFWMDHADSLEVVFRSGRTDIIAKNLSDKMEKMQDGQHLGFNAKELTYIAVSVTASICGILYVWIRSGKKETAKELNDMYEKLFAFHRK